MAHRRQRHAKLDLGAWGVSAVLLTPESEEDGSESMDHDVGS